MRTAFPRGVRRAVIITVASTMALTGCQAIRGGDAAVESASVSRAALPVGEALTIFQDVCVATFPSFTEFPAEAATAGLTERLRNGGLGSIDRSIAAVIREGEDGTSTCFVNFFTTATGPDAQSAFLAAFPGAVIDAGRVVAPVEGGRIVAEGAISRGDGNLFELRVQPGE